MSKLDQLRALRERKSSGGGVDGHAECPQECSQTPPLNGRGRLSGQALIAGIKPGPPEIKRGRPRLGETRDKPWIAAKMSRATWYRRKAEARK